MAARWDSSITEGLGHKLKSFEASSGEQDQDRHIYLEAPSMDRRYPSGSSMNSRLSISSYQDQTYVDSPLTSCDSPRSEFSPSSQFNQLSLEREALSPSQNRSGDSFLFDIEKYGDPRISWLMYYDFKVTKTEAYYQLHSVYLPTEKYPARIQSDKVTKNGEKLHPCRFLNCTAKPFTRHYDLERHFKIHESVGDQVYCDYKKCHHEEPFRKDHCREHYREYHAEDLVKKSPQKNIKHGQGQKRAETVEEFLTARVNNLDLSWWRCPKCIIRVHVVDASYTCPNCKIACETVRVTWRENARKARGENITESGQSEGVIGCGQCENEWVEDVNSPTGWAPCPRCHPIDQ